mmetsp:Transcript_44791/g.109887  ORF Transcript_44791/g.109887 Transcript_44791/m.109887 type:complete len:206 (+) Transcript_44791:550-1167(+)
MFPGCHSRACRHTSWAQMEQRQTARADRCASRRLIPSCCGTPRPSLEYPTFLVLRCESSLVALAFAPEAPRFRFRRHCHRHRFSPWLSLFGPLRTRGDRRDLCRTRGIRHLFQFLCLALLLDPAFWLFFEPQRAAASRVGPTRPLRNLHLRQSPRRANPKCRPHRRLRLWCQGLPDCSLLPHPQGGYASSSLPFACCALILSESN